MTRLFLSALLVLAPALPAAAQVRAAASEPAVPSAGTFFVPSLSASGAAVLSPGAGLSTPGLLSPGSAASAPLPALPAAAVNAAPAFPAATAPLPVEQGAAPSAAFAAAIPAAPDRAPASAKTGPVVLHSLQDLHVLFQAADGGALVGPAAYDGARDAFGSVSDPGFGRPQILAGMSGVAVKSVRGGLSEFQAHEVATIRKIQIYTSDLKVIVREAAATPDLVVNGVVTELKSVHRGMIDHQLLRANTQLISHAKRHGLGLGAVVLDVVGKPLTSAQIEEKIAQVVREEPSVGFSRVYVFHKKDLKTYAPGADGAFRLDSSAEPFAPPAKIAPAPASVPAPASAFSFVPSAVSRAVLPDLDVVKREIEEPLQRLRAHGIEATVTMYGSARILSPEKARAKLDAATAEVGRRPRDKAQNEKLEAAREALRMSKYYQIARELGALVAKEGGGKVAVVTGGGPGIMEGGNRGAFEAGGPSVGYNIKLPFEQEFNPYATPGLEFTFDNFTTRQMSMRHGSMGLVYFPGGFGTMYELFEVLTLMQTGKMAKVPIVLVGERAYWDRILDFEEFARRGLIAHDDLSLFKFAEDAPQAWAAIRAAHAAPAAQ
jgi:hypothetical protein